MLQQLMGQHKRKTKTKQTEYDQINPIQPIIKQTHPSTSKSIKYFIGKPFFKHQKDYLVYNNNKYYDHSHSEHMDLDKFYWYCSHNPKCHGSITTSIAKSDWEIHGECGEVLNYKPCDIFHTPTWTTTLAKEKFLLHILCMF